MIGDSISLKVNPGQENKLISLVMSSVALLSSFMSSTGVVAFVCSHCKKDSSI